MLSVAWKTASYALRVGCGVHVVHSMVYELAETHGESMLPTLSFSDDWVHVNKFCRRGKHCQVGDLIVATKPTDPEQRICKRITGMPGDIVLVDPSADDYEKYIEVPEGHCWVTGDNLTQSLDSRSYGPLPLGLIKGKIFGALTYETWYRWKLRWLSNSLSDQSAPNSLSSECATSASTSTTSSSASKAP